ncbi:hypothetical protein PAHAL_3G176200 [Panicum hallii]|uniref:Uncharacterized protein n=1 Tax=Panicum hallii TaxID=206008 RepID=A0A2S3H9H9_9POAL|nr:hypothetical protein PAHAL_3G176200 [Panicum hallii]
MEDLGARGGRGPEAPDLSNDEQTGPRAGVRGRAREQRRKCSSSRVAARVLELGGDSGGAAAQASECARAQGGLQHSARGGKSSRIWHAKVSKPAAHSSPASARGEG